MISCHLLLKFNLLNEMDTNYFIVNFLCWTVIVLAIGFELMSVSVYNSVEGLVQDCSMPIAFGQYHWLFMSWVPFQYKDALLPVYGSPC